MPAMRHKAVTPVRSRCPSALELLEDGDNLCGMLGVSGSNTGPRTGPTLQSRSNARQWPSILQSSLR
eukprot:10338681-Alexandrium_andersonii.AAC.1